MSLSKYDLTITDGTIQNISLKNGEDLRFFSLREEPEILEDIDSRISINLDTNGNFDVFSDNDIQEPTKDFFIEVQPNGCMIFIDAIASLITSLNLLKHNQTNDVYLVCID